MNDFIEIRRILAIVLRRWWWLVIAIALGALLGNVISRQQTPVYQATTTILVGDSLKSTSVDRADIQISEALVQTYVEIAHRQPVLQGVVTALNLNESWQALSKQVQVTQIESTQLIEITVEASSPDMARTIADEIVNQMILLSPANIEGANSEAINTFNHDQIKSLQDRIVNAQKRLVEIEAAMSTSISEIQLADLRREKETLDGLLVEWERNYTELLTLNENKRNPTQLTVIESAHSNNSQIRPRIQLNTILGGILGAVIALGLIILLDFVDDTYKSLSDFSQYEEVNILGSVRKIRGRKIADKIVARLHPHSPITESYRIIRSRIRFKPVDKPTRSIMVTSSMPEEGKSITVANLAVVFAQANYRTVIVDADLRRPVLHDIFDVSNEGGLGDLLNSTDLTLEDCIKMTSVNNLKILTSGASLLDPSERLGSQRMEEILNELRTIAEIIVFDSPSALVFADAIVLSRRVDGVIVVIQAGKSKRTAITQTLFDLQNTNANILGSIFNQSPKSDSFSVNRAYMQERPQLPSPTAFVRKEKKGGGQFADLHASATPLQEPADIHAEETQVDVMPSDNITDSLQPELQEEAEAILASSQLESDLEVKGPDLFESERLRLEVESSSLESESEAQLEVSEVVAVVPENQTVVTESTHLEVETENVKESETHSHQNIDLTDKKGRKRRGRKNRHNGSGADEVHPDQMKVVPSNGNVVAESEGEASDMTDHPVTVAGQIKK
jgi:non-specific protein-tyrosine kinase